MIDTDAKAFTLIAVGCVGLAVAILRPSWLRWVPGKWFHVYRAGRITFMAAAGGCILFGAFLLGVIPQQLLGLCFVLWAFAFALGAVFDIANEPDE